MDWSNWDTDIVINKNQDILTNYDDFKVIYEDDYIFDLNEVEVINSIQNIDNKILWYSTTITAGLFMNIKKYFIELLNNYIYTQINNDRNIISNYFDGITIVPLVNHKYNIYDYYNLIKRLGINENTKTLIYYDSFNNFYNTLTNLNFTADKYDDINKNKNTNKYDIWYCSHIDLFPINSENWYMFRLPWYINQLIYASNYCKKGGTIVFTFDLRFLYINVYKELIALMSCFMEVNIYFIRLMPVEKCILIGSKLDIDKLTKWSKSKNVKILDNYTESFKKIDTYYISVKPVIVSLNIKINTDLQTSLNKIIDKYQKYINNKLKYIYSSSIKYNNIYDYFNIILKKTLINTYDCIKEKDYPYHINLYYINNYEKCIMKTVDFNKIYFKNLSTEKLEKIQLSNEQLFNILKPKYLKKITNIIRKKCKKKTIVDMTTYSGLFSIGFSKKFKNVVSINDDYGNHKMINNNIKLCEIKNINSVNDSSMGFILKNNTKYKLLFFDLTKNNVFEKNNSIIKYDDNTLDNIIDTIFKNCKNIHIFVLMTHKNFVSVKYEAEYIIDKFYLLYFTNVKL